MTTTAPTRAETLERAVRGFAAPAKGWAGLGLLNQHSPRLARYVDQALDEAAIAAAQQLGALVPLGGKVTDLEQIASLPAGSVLRCRVQEVFWVPEGQLGTRVWLAAGYDPAVYTWTDAEVLEWAPLTVLSLGNEL